MFGDRDHDRRVADGAVGAGVSAGILGSFIWLGMVKGYYELFRRFPKSTGCVTVLVLLALLLVKPISHGLNWFSVREHLPDGQYLVEHATNKLARHETGTKSSMLIKDGKVSRDGGKTFEEVKWERDVKKGGLHMITGTLRYEFYEREDDDGQTYFNATMTHPNGASLPTGFQIDKYTLISESGKD